EHAMTGERQHMQVSIDSVFGENLRQPQARCSLPHAREDVNTLSRRDKAQGSQHGPDRAWVVAPGNYNPATEVFRPIVRNNQDGPVAVEQLCVDCLPFRLATVGPWAR